MEPLIELGLGVMTLRDEKINKLPYQVAPNPLLFGLESTTYGFDRTTWTLCSLIDGKNPIRRLYNNTTICLYLEYTEPSTARTDHDYSTFAFPKIRECKMCNINRPPNIYVLPKSVACMFSTCSFNMTKKITNGWVPTVIISHRSSINLCSYLFMNSSLVVYMFWLELAFFGEIYLHYRHAS